MSIPVLIVEDHEIVRCGLESLFHGSPLAICGMTGSPKEAVRLARTLKPAVALVDVRLGNADGLELVKRIRTTSPTTRVVVFSAFDNPTYVARSVAAGAHDYVVKSAGRAELIEAVVGAARDVPPPRTSPLHRMAAALATREASTGGGLQLTPRETQTLRMVSMGLSNKEIADALQISVETVKEHVQNLLRKLRVNDRTQAAVWAIRHGID